MARHQFDPDHEAAPGQFLARRVLHDHEAGSPARRFRQRSQDGSWSELHFDGELLRHHLVAQPVGQHIAGLAGADLPHGGRREQRAEVSGDAREPLLEILVRGGGQPIDTAQVTGDHLGAGFVKQKARAIEQLHKRAGAREPAFRKQHEPPVGAEIFGHVFHGVRRIGVDRKGASIDHDAAMQPTDLCCRAGSDKPPVFVQASADEQPIQPGNVVWDQQHRAGRL